jgi:hypothetical protein
MEYHSFFPFVQIGDGFWNLRSSLTFLVGLVDVGTHMSVVRLRSGKFLILSTVELNESATNALKRLTDGGKLIEAVIATHPFHTLYFQSFYDKFPDAKFYGTPRHIRNISSIPWAGDISTPENLSRWESEGVFMRIPNCAEFINPADDNHFNSVFVYHVDSRTLHDDDTLGYFDHYPGFILSWVGAKQGVVTCHPSTLKNGLYPTQEAPLQFVAFIEQILNDWDFDNACLAHNGIKIGGVKPLIETCMTKMKPLLERLSNKNKGYVFM